MKNIKVSVIIPIYNVEKYLEECIRSAMAQTLKEIEIICVNDGSTDNSLEIVKSLAKNDSRIVIIDKKNGGYGETINIGISKAKGKYICILESDDYIDSNMYKDLYDCIEKNNVDFVKSNFYYLYGNGKNKIIIKSEVSDMDSFYNVKINPQMNVNLFIQKTTNWTGIYKTEFLRKNKIMHNETPGASYQDTGFCFKVYTSANSCVFLRNAYYYYRQDNPNASMRSKSKVYAIVNEYNFIRKNLENENLFETYKGIYTYKKFDAFFNFNYNRIGYEFKREFLEFMSDDFKKAIESKEYDDLYFSNEEKKVFLDIAKSPEQFYIENLKWRVYAHGKDKKYLINLIKKKTGTQKYKIAKKIAHFLGDR